MVTKLDRLARSLPDARAIADELTTRQISLSLGGSVYDPTDAVGRLLFNVLAMVAEFESDLIRLRTVEGMKVARAKGRLRGKQPKLNRKQEWDQGPEMRDWEKVRIDAGIDIYFCDPHSPWQRGTNENFNGLLGQYFPKGTDLSAHMAADLDWAAAELNDRPLKRLAFQKPIELIGDLLLR